MAAANDLRKGMAIKYNGNTAIVEEVHHRTPGNLRAFVQAIIRYIGTGKKARACSTCGSFSRLRWSPLISRNSTPPAATRHQMA